MKKDNKKAKEKRITDRAMKNRRIIIGFTSGFAALVILLGAILGTVLAVRDRSALVKYSGVMMDKGVVSYLSATYKNEYMSNLKRAGIDVYDDESFWTKDAEGGKTYGELLRSQTELYIKGVAVGSYLFDRYTSLTSEDKQTLSRAKAEVLDYKADGSEERFNELTAEMGFNYADFSEATDLIYKAQRAKSVIYGTDGSVLSSGNFYSECDEFYETYSHVKLLFITTSRDFVKSEDGEFELDSDGNFATRLLTDAEIEERAADIAEIRALILAYESDGDVQMSPEYFERMQEKYNFDSSHIKGGYYFSENSTYTSRFPIDSAYMLDEDIGDGFTEQLSLAVKTSLDMSVGEYKEVRGDFAICFIYKYENEDYAYLSSSYSAFFHDFFSDAADYLYAKTLDELSAGVEIRDGYYDIDVVALPYNYVFYASFDGGEND